MDIAEMETDQAEKDKCVDMIKLSLDKQENFVKKLLDQAVNYKEINLEAIDFKIFCDSIIEEISNYEQSI